MPEPGSPEWKIRVSQMLAAEMGQPESWWYLSFADEGKWLGGCFIKARGPTHALAETMRLGINPGGQVLTMSVDKPHQSHQINTLLTTAEQLGPLERVTVPPGRSDDRTN